MGENRLHNPFTGSKKQMAMKHLKRCPTSLVIWETQMKAVTIVHLSAQSLSYVQLFVTPWTVACQAPLSVESYLADKNVKVWQCQVLIQSGSNCIFCSWEFHTHLEGSRRTECAYYNPMTLRPLTHTPNGSYTGAGGSVSKNVCSSK